MKKQRAGRGPYELIHQDDRKEGKWPLVNRSSSEVLGDETGRRGR